MYRLQLLLIGVNDGVPSPPLLSSLGDTPLPPCSPVSKSKVFYIPFGVPVCVLVSVWFCFNLGCGKEDGRGVLRPSSPVLLSWGCFSSPPRSREAQWQGRGSSLTQQPLVIPNPCLCICCSPSHLGTTAWEVLWRNRGDCRAGCEPGMSH